jgi:tRNA(Ile)-lysidine synthase
MSLQAELSREIKDFASGKFLLAVSGGLDSMALLSFFLWCRERWEWPFSVAHYHHGLTGDPQTDDYRTNAQDFVSHHCQRQQVEFFTNPLPKALDSASSEQALREARYTFLHETLPKAGAQHLVLGHHREDLLETRMLRLIRGTGPQGLEAMTLSEPPLLRPFLPLSRAQLKELVGEGQGWLEDPSNDNLDPLRNWLRKKWLPELEAKRAGSVLSLARSLDQLAEMAHQTDPKVAGCWSEEGIHLDLFWGLTVPQQRQVIAAYMRGQGLRDYGLSHIQEVLKRLDTEKKSLTFSLLGRRWKVDAGRMRVEPRT